MKTRVPHSQRSGGRPSGPASRGAGPRSEGRSGTGDLARIVAATDDLEQALEALERAPGIREAVLGELRRRRPGLDRPSPWSTALLVRLAGRVGGADGLAALIPFLADANPQVQVEAAEAVDVVPLGELAGVLERVARERPEGEFWDAVLGLLESREERGIARVAAGLTERLSGPGPLAAVLEALPYLGRPEDVALVKRTLRRFVRDNRAVPGAETDEGPVTLAFVAAEALEALADAEPEATDEDGGR
jgi:hypothetical protein